LKIEDVASLFYIKNLNKHSTFDCAFVKLLSTHRGNRANEKAPVMFFSSADHVSNQSFTRDAAHTFNRLQQGESGEKSGPRQGGRRKRDGNVAAYHRAKSSKVVY